MAVRCIVSQWVVSDGDRFIGLISRDLSGGTFDAYLAGSASVRKTFPTRSEATAWIVARDAVRAESRLAVRRAGA